MILVVTVLWGLCAGGALIGWWLDHRAHGRTIKLAYECLAGWDLALTEWKKAAAERDQLAAELGQTLGSLD